MKGKKEREERANGGEVRPYDAQGSNVEKEAEERKRGGRAKRARGGKVEHEHRREHERHVEGKKVKERLDRPHRASGGRVGSDKSPFTSARYASEPRDHKADSGGTAD